MQFFFKKSIVLSWVFISLQIMSNAQVANQFGLGISAGYRLNSGCFFVDYGISKKLLLANTYGLDKYHGFGVGIGIEYYPLNNVKFKPYSGATFTRTLGTSFSYGPDNNPTVFKVDDAIYLTPYLGLKYDDIGTNKKYKNYFSYILTIGYKVSALDFPNVDLYS